MDMPSQVRAAAERANELLAQAGTPTGEAAATAPAPAPTEPPAAEPPASPPAATPAEPAPAPAPEPAPAATPADSEQSFEHKYRTLQGIIEANSRKHNEERSRLEQQIQQLSTQLAQIAAQPPAPAPAPAAPASLVTDKDVETYGPELLDVIGRKAQEMAQQIVAAKMAELQPVLAKTQEQVGQVAQQAYQNVQERFFGELAKEVPDWQTVNSDARFHAWLSEVDPMSQVQRQVYLTHAQKNLDHEHAARLFNAFKSTLEPARPPVSAPPPATPNLSPRPVGTATAPVPREPVVTVKRSEINGHYRRSSMDPMYRRSDEYQAMEKRIATASATGQIEEG